MVGDTWRWLIIVGVPERTFVNGAEFPKVSNWLRHCYSCDWHLFGELIKCEQKLRYATNKITSLKTGDLCYTFMPHIAAHSS